jgi:5,10-methylenetetrahydromethanopterin reductase
LRPLLQGEDIPFDLDVDDLGGRLRPVEDLRLADRPDTIKLRWLPKDYVPAPINVTGTGPKVIAIGARYADQISFAVGADPNRITQAIQFANAQRFAAGLEGKPLLLGIYALVLPIEDRERALALASSGVAASARFSVMHGRVTGIGTDEKQAETLESLHGAYDMNHHAHAGSPQADVITPQFIESFSIIGPPGYCVDRLLELAELGVSRVVVSRGAVGADRETIAESQRAMSTAVLPHLT